jgi:hypothetical protein
VGEPPLWAMLRAEPGPVALTVGTSRAGDNECGRSSSRKGEQGEGGEGKPEGLVAARDSLRPSLTLLGRWSEGEKGALNED